MNPSAAPSAASASETLLCVMNYPANSGYAWNYIENLCARLADRLAASGVRTWIAYPSIPSRPRALEGSIARPVVLDARAKSVSALFSVLHFVKRHRVTLVYFAENEAYSWKFPLLRLAGVRRIVVHYHHAGAVTPARGFRRSLKQVRARLPGLGADAVITVSDFVATVHRQGALTPAPRVARVWNSIPVPNEELIHTQRQQFREQLGIPPDAILLTCGCRAALEKGVDVLLRAFELARAAGVSIGADLRLAYAGDGVDFERFQEIRNGLASKDQIHFIGRVSDASALLSAADIVVVPSNYDEAFGLAALEGMAHQKPVVASRVGGIPEMVRHEEEGLLVPAGDEKALAEAILRLARDRSLAREMGVRGRERVRTEFRPDYMIEQMAALVYPNAPSAQRRNSGRGLRG